MPDSDDAITQSHLELNRRIRERAYQIWTSRGGKNTNGTRDTALEDWLEAEREILDSDDLRAAQNRGTVVGNPRGELIPPSD